MKVCISSSGNSVESSLDSRFGRAAYFIIVDIETNEIEIVENSASSGGGGVGITSGQLIIDKDVGAVITGNVGPNAMNVLKTAEIDIFQGKTTSVANNIEEFKKGTLKKIDTTVPSHFGMQGGQ